MVLKVYKYGEKVLREKARPVAVVDDTLRKLADDMIETMHAARGLVHAAHAVVAACHDEIGRASCRERV